VSQHVPLIVAARDDVANNNVINRRNYATNRGKAGRIPLEGDELNSSLARLTRHVGTRPPEGGRYG
jgi:hypothetical protein